MVSKHPILKRRVGAQRVDQDPQWLVPGFAALSQEAESTALGSVSLFSFYLEYFFFFFFFF